MDSDRLRSPSSLVPRANHEEMALAQFGYATCKEPPLELKTDRSTCTVALMGLSAVFAVKFTLFSKYGSRFTNS